MPLQLEVSDQLLTEWEATIWMEGPTVGHICHRTENHCNRRCARLGGESSHLHAELYRTVIVKPLQAPGETAP